MTAGPAVEVFDMAELVRLDAVGRPLDAAALPVVDDPAWRLGEDPGGQLRLVPRAPTGAR